MTTTCLEAPNWIPMSSPARIPWEIVETFPSTDADLIALWNSEVEVAATPPSRARALIGRALVHYWAVQEHISNESWQTTLEGRENDVDEALRIARAGTSTELLAAALLGKLYATWGPDHLADRGPIIAEIAQLRNNINDEELQLRIIEWLVIDKLDSADLEAASALINEFASAADGTELVLFRRREVLWYGCIAMLEGRIDEAVQINQEAISSTANTAGSPFSFQNVAITIAVERYFRRCLGDVIDTIQSIRASSPRVAPNWESGLAFAYSETGSVADAAEMLANLGVDNFEAVPRDLNWLVTMYLLALVAVNVDDRERGLLILDQIRPFAELDATHGTGYASYGPVGRVVASIASRWGDPIEATYWFDHVLSTRSPGPWTSLTQLDRAIAHSTTDPDAALLDAVQADAQLRGFGLDKWADIARDLGEELQLKGHGGPISRLANNRWTLRHPSGSATIDTGVGAAHLMRLLTRPGQAVDVTELDPIADPSLTTHATTESSLDQLARAAYRRRINELEAIDSPSADSLDELSFLKRELSGAAHHISSSAELERARVRVTKAIRRAIDEISNQSAELGAHLREAIETGRHCLYDPHQGTAWHVVRHDD